MKSTLKKEDAARESTPRTAIEDSRARAYGSEKPEARVIQRAICGYHPGPFTWRTRRAVPKKYQRSTERFLVTGDANAIGTKHRILNPPQPAILNPAILKNLAAAPHHARALAIAPERTCRFIQKSENATVSSRTQSPCDMASRPSKTHIMTINHVPGLRLLTQHRTSEGRHPTYNRPYPRLSA